MKTKTNSLEADLFSWKKQEGVLQELKGTESCGFFFFFCWSVTSKGIGYYSNKQPCWEKVGKDGFWVPGAYVKGTREG